MMVLTDNKYQCAPFPCIEGTSNIEMMILKLVLMMKIIMVGKMMVLIEDKFLSLIKKIIDVALKTNFLA